MRENTCILATANYLKTGVLVSLIVFASSIDVVAESRPLSMFDRLQDESKKPIISNYDESIDKTPRIRPDPKKQAPAKASPVVGAIYDLGDGTWQVQLFNSSKSDLAVTGEVLEMDRHGFVVGSEPIAVNIESLGSHDLQIVASPGTVDCKLRIGSSKNLEQKEQDQR